MSGRSRTAQAQTILASAMAFLAMSSLSSCDTEQRRIAREKADRAQYQRLRSTVTKILCDSNTMERAHALSRMVQDVASEAEA